MLKNSKGVGQCGAYHTNGSAVSHMLLAVIAVAILLTIKMDSSAAEEPACTVKSRARFERLTQTDVKSFRDLLFSMDPPPNVQQMVFKWPDGIKLGMTGLYGMTARDVAEVLRAKDQFQQVMGPGRDVIAFPRFAGDPFTDRSADINFVLFFYDSAKPQPDDSETLKRLLAYVLESDSIATSVLDEYSKYGVHTMLQVHPLAKGMFDRGLAAIDLASARKAGLSEVIFSLLAASTSPAILQSIVRDVWIDSDGKLLPSRREPMMDYIAFLYCSPLPPGAGREEVAQITSTLPR